MSKQVMINLLRQGNNGEQILSILDSFTSDNVWVSDDIESPVSDHVLAVIDF